MADASNSQKDFWDILQALSPFLIGIAALFLAYLQWHTTEKQRKQTLYSARYEAYEKILFISQVLQSRRGTTGLEKMIKEKIEENFYFLKHQFKFLFPKKCQVWLETFYNIYLSFDERANLGERASNELWESFKQHVNSGLEILQKETQVY